MKPIPEKKRAMDIFEVFRSAANPEKATQMSAYMRNLFPFLGIQGPQRKRLSRDYFKTMDRAAVDWDFVFRCWKAPERRRYTKMRDPVKIAKTLNILYQVRCNFFHGDKMYGRDSDDLVVANAAELLTGIVGLFLRSS